MKRTEFPFSSLSNLIHLISVKTYYYFLAVLEKPFTNFPHLLSNKRNTNTPLLTFSISKSCWKPHLITESTINEQERKKNGRGKKKRKKTNTQRDQISKTKTTKNSKYTAERKKKGKKHFSSSLSFEIETKNWDGKWGGKNTRKRERERRERACVRVRVRYRPGGRQCFDNGARLTESTARRGWRSERAVGPRVHAGNRNKWWRGASCTSHREPVTPRCLRTRSARVE